jgi:hypothetical protein
MIAQANLIRPVYDIIYSQQQRTFFAISKKHLYQFSKNPDRFIPRFDLHYTGLPGPLYKNQYFGFTTDRKLYKLNIETGEEKIISLNKKIPEGEIKENGMYGVVDKKGLLWIYTVSMGLFRYDTNTDEYEQFVHEPGNPGSIPSNNVRYIFA